MGGRENQRPQLPDVASVRLLGFSWNDCIFHWSLGAQRSFRNYTSIYQGAFFRNFSSCASQVWYMYEAALVLGGNVKQSILVGKRGSYCTVALQEFIFPPCLTVENNGADMQ